MNSIKKIKLKTPVDRMSKISNDSTLKANQAKEELQENKKDILNNKFKFNSRNHITIKISNCEKDTKTKNDRDILSNLPHPLLSEGNKDSNISKLRTNNPFNPTNFAFGNIGKESRHNKAIKTSMKGLQKELHFKKNKSISYRKYKVFFKFNPNNCNKYNYINDSHNAKSNSNINDNDNDNGHNSNSNNNLSFSSEESNICTIKPVNQTHKQYMNENSITVNSKLDKSDLLKKPNVIEKGDYIINNLIRITQNLKRSSPNATVTNKIAYSKLNEYKPVREIVKSNAKCISELFNDYYSPKAKHIYSPGFSIRKNRNRNNRCDIIENSNALNMPQLKERIKKKKALCLSNYCSTLSPGVAINRMLQSQSYFRDNEIRRLTDEPYNCISNNYIKHLLISQRNNIKKTIQ